MRIRKIFYRMTLAKCGREVAFGFGTIISYRDIEIGNRVRFGPYNTLGYVKMGDDIITAQYVHFLSGSKQHGYRDLNIPMNIQPGKSRTIELGNDIWIGCNVVVMDSVGNGCIIGSGSVITKNVSSYNIVAGNPARIIKRRE
jgi:acetyltransferase-like isoleucine patch superfamily enzyme